MTVADPAHGASGTGLGWLLDDLVVRVPHIRQAVVLSRDGLVVAASKNLARDDAEQLAAVASGLHSLARGAAAHFHGGRVHQTMIEMDRSFLFVTAAGEGSCLAVLADVGTDVGLVAYEMAVLVQRLGSHLTVQPRLVPAQGPPE